jgi:shikimate dehydrogenase
MPTFGLIGFPLTHSFSKKYFSEKFENLGIAGTHSYELFEMENASEFLELFRLNPNLIGLNVTIPHKLSVIPLVDILDISAEKVGAVNVIKRLPDGRLKGYNSDYYGFKKSLLETLDKRSTAHLKALVLGYGGAAKAIIAALEDLEIPYQIVSRNPAENQISYQETTKYLATHQLIINCSPLGTYPKVDASPAIDYDQITNQHIFMDLVYNPALTQFLEKGKTKGATIQNGYQMLVYQAEKAWEIWQENQ